jgi:hypothetical protein
MFGLKKLIYAFNGKVPLQYFNKSTDQFEVQEGSGGSAQVTLTGSNGAKANVDGTGSLQVKIAGAEDTGGGALGVDVKSSQIIQPVDIQARYAQTIQTQPGVSILPTQANVGSWIDSHVNGAPLTYLGVTASMASGTGMTVKVSYSHDGTNIISETVVYDGTGSAFGTDKDIQLPSRYFRITIINKDAATPKTTSAYAYLKA